MKPLMIPHTNADGTVTFKGFLVDLIERLAYMTDFDYTLSPVPDGYFGSNVNGTHWNGVIGELQSQVILSEDVYIIK